MWSKMDPSVPITCTLPFNGDMWRRSNVILKSVRLFRHNFIRGKLLRANSAPCYWTEAIARDLDISKKITVVNNIIHFDTPSPRRADRIQFANGQSPPPYEQIMEALNDLELFEDLNNEGEILSEDELPYLLINIIGAIDYTHVGGKFIDEYMLIGGIIN
jgi:hypothetical protein